MEISQVIFLEQNLTHTHIGGTAMLGKIPCFHNIHTRTNPHMHTHALHTRDPLVHTTHVTHVC